jgi:hypothetical protein
MYNKNMKNAITLQDQYIAKVLAYEPKGATYYTLLTKASKALRAGLVALGFSHTEAQTALEDAVEVVQNARACGAKSAEECICDGLNFAEYEPLTGSIEDGDRFSFDGTEEDFIRQALKAGLKVYGDFSNKVYLHEGTCSTLLSVYRNEWLGKLSCACVVSKAPLRELLKRSQLEVA